MIQQVQNSCQFHGLPGDDANRHIDKFLEVTQHMKQNEVSNDALHLSLFLYSLTHHATLANPRGDVKAITTRSGVAYDGPTILSTSSPLPKEVKRETKATKDKVQTTRLESTAHVQPPVVQVTILEPDVAPKRNPKPSIPYPSRLNDQELYEKANNQMLKFIQIIQRLHFDISFADALLHMPKFASTFKSLLSNKEKLFKLAIDYDVDPRVPLILGKPFLRTVRALIDFDEWQSHSFGSYHCFFFSLIHSFEGGDFILEEIETFLRTLDELFNLADDYYDTEGDILYLEKLLNEDSSLNLPPMKNEDLKKVHITMTKPSIEEPPELKLKDLPPYLEYAFLEGIDKLPVIISKELKDEENAALLKILMDDDFKPAVQHQRKVNPKIHEVIKKEVIKLLYARLIYPIFDSLWVHDGHFPRHDQGNNGGLHRQFLGLWGFFSSCLSHLDKMLKRCENTNLALNWEKCHFMVKEGIVLGHKIYKFRIEVDRAKVDVIAKLPYPTFIKGVRSFLGHVRFYCRFIQDFSKIARPMTHLLEKETSFIFSKECIEAFNILKKKLIEAPILVTPD
uniref:Reverse transcriptase domain-containing protein n=1 Tax=Tanacetum cinerariifolium TaxID=118510 RepID=A0A6L2LVZ6_TANCI|nr:hypothetical protein [Tanacetum cinerariifolium]